MNGITLLLAHNGYLPAVQAKASATPDPQALGSVLAAMAACGRAPNTALLAKLARLSRASLVAWWETAKPALENVTGVDRNMDEFVVYKNFPGEVLAMDRATYWINQIYMYLGAPNDLFTETALPREADTDMTLTIMGEGDHTAVLSIRDSLLAQKAGWTDEMKASVMTLLESNIISHVSFEDITSRENAAWLAAAWLMQTRDAAIDINTPMDVLRIAAAWSGNDASLRIPGKIGTMPRWLRRRMITWLSIFGQDRLEADFVMRPKSWKPLLHALHTGTVPGALGLATENLRKGNLRSYDSLVETGLREKNPEVLSLLTEKPGVFARRLHHVYSIFGAAAFTAFSVPACLDKLTTETLLKLAHYFKTVNARSQFLYTPKGQMSKAQVGTKTKCVITQEDLNAFVTQLETTIGQRLDAAHPEGFAVDASAANVGLLLNGQESGVGRGTTYAIPEGMTFLRTASYWKTGNGQHNIWFDNGWNFFDSNWNAKGGVCWNHEREEHRGKPLGVFSGDPTNSKDLEGRACQMIDIYFDRLAKAGITYAVWTILSYNSMPFGDAHDVLGTLQWGKDPSKGKLFEPARAQITLPLSGPDKAKIVAVVNVVDRTLTFVDANLPMIVESTMRGQNFESLSTKLPALMESINSTPTVGDLFSLARPGTIPVTFSEDNPVVGKGLVFSPKHPDSNITQLDVQSLLTATG